jgi:hypothetical protein
VQVPSLVAAQVWMATIMATIRIMSDMEFYEMSKQRQMGHSDMGAQGGGNEVRDVICLSVILRRERPLGVAEGLHGVIALV